MLYSVNNGDKLLNYSNIQKCIGTVILMLQLFIYSIPECVKELSLVLVLLFYIWYLFIVFDLVYITVALLFVMSGLSCLWWFFSCNMCLLLRLFIRTVYTVYVYPIMHCALHCTVCNAVAVVHVSSCTVSNCVACVHVYSCALRNCVVLFRCPLVTYSTMHCCTVSIYWVDVVVAMLSYNTIG